MLDKLRLFILEKFVLGGRLDMAMIYCLLIIKEIKVFTDVPPTLKEQVRQLLIDMEAEHLIVE